MRTSAAAMSGPRRTRRTHLTSSLLEAACRNEGRRSSLHCFCGDERPPQGRQRFTRETFLEQREELPLLVPDVRAEKRTKLVRPIQRPPAWQRRGAIPDLRMLVAHTASRGSPLGVIVRQGRQYEPLLDHEVMLALAIPEVEEALDSLLEGRIGRAPEAQGDLKRDVVVTG